MYIRRASPTRTAYLVMYVLENQTEGNQSWDIRQ